MENLNKGGRMKDICELCSLCSPNMGCTKLENESCLKEAIKLIKPSVTDGEVIQTMFPGAKFCCTERLQTAGLPRRDADFDLDFWNAKWGE